MFLGPKGLNLRDSFTKLQIVKTLLLIGIVFIPCTGFSESPDKPTHVDTDPPVVDVPSPVSPKSIPATGVDSFLETRPEIKSGLEALSKTKEGRDQIKAFIGGIGRLAAMVESSANKGEQVPETEYSTLVESLRLQTKEQKEKAAAQLKSMVTQDGVKQPLGELARTGLRNITSELQKRYAPGGTGEQTEPGVAGTKPDPKDPNAPKDPKLAQKPPETPEEKKARQVEEELQALRKAALQRDLIRSAQEDRAKKNGGSGGGGGGGGGKDGGAGGGGSPPEFGRLSGDNDLARKAEEHKNTKPDPKFSETRGLLGDNNNFGKSDNQSSIKDPFKKDDKEGGGIKIPETRLKKSEDLAKTPEKKTEGGAGATDPTSPEAFQGQGPTPGYSTGLTLSGPSNVPGLVTPPNPAALLAAAAAADGGGGGGDGGNPFAGSNVKGGGGGGGAGGGGGGEGGPFNLTESYGAAGPGGAPFRKISPESGASTDGDSVESSPSVATNDFKKKGSILDQIITLGPSDEERLKDLGVMAFVARKERICLPSGREILERCRNQTRINRSVTVGDDSL